MTAKLICSEENWMTEQIFCYNFYLSVIKLVVVIKRKSTYLLHESLILGFFHDKVCFLLFFWLFGDAPEEVGVDGEVRNDDMEGSEFPRGSLRA